MQYKIPVHIENDDPIIFGLGLKQLTIIMGACGIAYGVYNSLESFGQDVALIPSIIIALLGIIIAIFKQYEMTFLPFILALLSFNINFKERFWGKGIDSFSTLEMGNVILNQKTETEKIDLEDKMDKIKNLENSLDKI